MTQVKKVFQPLVDLLEANKDVKVSKIMEQIIELTMAKANRAEGSTFLKDAKGNTIAIFDYYFKRWMPLVGEKAVEFGAKQKTATGFNVMCKEGVSHWTKQQREAKNASSDLLKKVSSGEIKPSEIAAYQAQIEEGRKAIAKTELGFEKVEDLNKYLAKNGVDVGAATKAAA